MASTIITNQRSHSQITRGKNKNYTLSLWIPRGSQRPGDFSPKVIMVLGDVKMLSRVTIVTGRFAILALSVIASDY